MMNQFVNNALDNQHLLKESRMNNLIFVYGTLKTNHGNWDYFLKDKSEYVGKYTTNPEYQMVCLGGFPGVLLHGNISIKGELFRVDDATMRSVDGLEGFPTFYNRKQIETPEGLAWMYYLEGERYRSYQQVENGDWK